eukprot:6246627-Amphidinium_carterae.1
MSNASDSFAVKLCSHLPRSQGCLQTWMANVKGANAFANAHTIAYLSIVQFATLEENFLRRCATHLDVMMSKCSVLQWCIFKLDPGTPKDFKYFGDPPKVSTDTSEFLEFN